MREANGLPCGPLGVDEKGRNDGEDSSRSETLGRLAHRPAISRNGWPAPPRQPTAALCPSAEGFGGSARGAPSAGRAFGDAHIGEATHFPRIGGSLVAFRSGRSGRFYVSSASSSKPEPPDAHWSARRRPQGRQRPQRPSRPARSPWARRQRLRPPPRTAPSTPASGKSRRLAAAAPMRPRASRSRSVSWPLPHIRDFATDAARLTEASMIWTNARIRRAPSCGSSVRKADMAPRRRTPPRHGSWIAFRYLPAQLTHGRVCGKAPKVRRGGFAAPINCPSHAPVKAGTLPDIEKTVGLGIILRLDGEHLFPVAHGGVSVVVGAATARCGFVVNMGSCCLMRGKNDRAPIRRKPWLRRDGGR